MLCWRTCVRNMPSSSEEQALQRVSPCDHRSETRAMECKTCDSLLADYKYSIQRFTEAVRCLPGLVGRDRELAHQKLEQLRLACRNADNALTAHRRQNHADLTAKR
jgi:hypothetical protein